MKKVLGVMLLCAAVAVQGVPFKKVVGQAFPPVKVKNAVSGEEIDLSKLLANAATKGAVVFFTSTKCPVAASYEGRVSELAEKSAASIPFLSLNANSDEDAAALTAYSKEKGFKFYTAKDEGSKIAKEIGAGCTPEFYVLDKAGKVVYHGPLDDSLDTAQVKKKYLSDAIDAVNAGKPVPEADREIQPSGCTIKFPGAEKKGAEAAHHHEGEAKPADKEHNHKKDK